MPGINTYNPGDVARISCSFAVAGIATDPTTVTLKVKGPTIGIVTYTYSATISKDATGVYHLDYTIPAAGTYFYRWEATGTVIAASEGEFLATTYF